MGKSLIYGCMLTHQCVILDYPLESVLNCCMDVCDAVLINDGGSTDGTQDILLSVQNRFGKDRIIIVDREWKHDRTFWSDQRNTLIDIVDDNAYVFAIDADELIHENDIFKIKNLIESDVKSISFSVIHFYGRPTHYIEGPVWYKRHTRLWKKSTGIRIVHRPGGCADDVLWPDGYPAHLGRYIDSGVSLYHYGNCRDPKSLGMKAKKADDLYQNSTNYIDGSLPKARSFSYVFDRSGAKKFKGSHPKYIKEWYENHKNQPTYYDAGDGEDNRLWCFKGK